MKDHLSWRTTTYSWQKVPHFNATEPVTKDHLSWQTTFLWPLGWSCKTGSTVCGPSRQEAFHSRSLKTGFPTWCYPPSLRCPHPVLPVWGVGWRCLAQTLSLSGPPQGVVPGSTGIGTHLIGTTGKVLSHQYSLTSTHSPVTHRMDTSCAGTL